MSALTISAVDSTTDRLTITAHGLTTGDGPCAIYTATGAIPGGLAGNTDYWAIVVDANTIKLATSNANALAGTAIDITSNGSGALFLLVGLPYRRARTYAALAQLKSADMNALQDNQAALWNFLTGQAQSVYAGVVLASGQHVQLQGAGLYKRGTRVRHIAGMVGVLTTGSGAGPILGYFRFTASGQVARYLLLVEEGEQLTTVRAHVANAATDLQQLSVWKLVVISGSAGEAQLGTTQTSSGHSSLVETLSVSGLTQPVSNGIEYYVAQVNCSAYGSAPYVVSIDYTTAIP